MMRLRRASLIAALSLLWGCVASDAARVRITTDRDIARGCTFVAMASAETFKDLQRKAARLGGDKAVAKTQRNLLGPIQGVEFEVLTYADVEVFRCEDIPREAKGQ